MEFEIDMQILGSAVAVHYVVRFGRINVYEWVNNVSAMQRSTVATTTVVTSIVVGDKITKLICSTPRLLPPIDSSSCAACCCRQAVANDLIISDLFQFTAKQRLYSKATSPVRPVRGRVSH